MPMILFVSGIKGDSPDNHFFKYTIESGNNAILARVDLTGKSSSSKEPASADSFDAIGNSSLLHKELSAGQLFFGQP